MYTIYITMGLGIFLALCLCYFYRRAEEGWAIFRYVKAMLYGTALGLFLGIAVASTIGFFNSSIEDGWRTCEPLGPVHREKNYRDTFLLSPSRADPEGTYVFMIKSENWHAFNELTANDLVQVTEDKSLHGTGSLVKVRGRRVVNNDPWLKRWAMIFSPEHIVRYEFHVPVGTTARKNLEKQDF